MFLELLNRFKKLIYDATLKERSPHKLALSCSIGTFIAFNPLIGMHTVITVFFAWLLRLNFAVTFAISNLINNPFTMIPIYAINNVFGDWLLNVIFNIDSKLYNPSSLNWLNQTVFPAGLPGLSLFGFLIGGHLLGLCFSVILYPILLVIFRELNKKLSSL